METLLQNMTTYVYALDWAYILTFILISYGINHYKITELISHWVGVKIRTRYRVLIIGFTYAVIIYFIRGYQIAKVECLFQSFLFALVFHKLLVDTLVSSFFSKTLKNEDR